MASASETRSVPKRQRWEPLSGYIEPARKALLEFESRYGSKLPDPKCLKARGTRPSSDLSNRISAFGSGFTECVRWVEMHLSPANARALKKEILGLLADLKQWEKLANSGGHFPWGKTPQDDHRDEAFDHYTVVDQDKLAEVLDGTGDVADYLEDLGSRIRKLPNWKRLEPRLRIHLTRRKVTLDGIHIPVTNPQHRVLLAIAKRAGDWVRSSTIIGERSRAQTRGRPDRIIKGLDARLRKLVQVRRGDGGGYRIRREIVALIVEG
jgi:hypothetical protein